jgi:hypothetical protein
MSRSRLALVLAAVIAAAVAAPAGAQQGRGPRPPRDEGLFRMVEAYLVSNLQEALALSDDQFARVLPHVKRLQRDRRDTAQRRMRALQELRRVMQVGGATEARVGELLREVKAAEAEGPAIVRKDMDALDGMLTPVQQAKYRLLEVEVERRLRTLMSNRRTNRGRAPEFPEN